MNPRHIPHVMKEYGSSSQQVDSLFGSVDSASLPGDLGMGDLSMDNDDGSLGMVAEQHVVPPQQGGRFPLPPRHPSASTSAQIDTSVKLELSQALYNNHSGKEHSKSRSARHYSSGSRAATTKAPSTTSSTSSTPGPIHTSHHASNRSQPYSPSELKTRRKLRKNTREKQRRMELNDKFDMLFGMLNLAQKAKTEKFTILSEAINLINSLRHENSELKKERAQLHQHLQKMTNAMQKAFPSQPPIDLSMQSINTGDGKDALGGPPPLSPVIGNSLPPIPKLPTDSILPFTSTGALELGFNSNLTVTNSSAGSASPPADRMDQSAIMTDNPFNRTSTVSPNEFKQQWGTTATAPFRSSDNPFILSRGANPSPFVGTAGAAPPAGPGNKLQLNQNLVDQLQRLSPPPFLNNSPYSTDDGSMDSDLDLLDNSPLPPF